MMGKRVTLGWVMAAAAVLGLSACMPGALGQSKTSASGQTSTRLVERDVEAPKVFSASEAGLWDGRPSLGGVWVAYPGVKDPERVIIRNASNGKFVIGALFRRESQLPGPKLQVSSDAAQALGLVAGVPTKLDVTALRREAAPEATLAPAAPVLDKAETIATEHLAPAKSDGKAVAAAAVAAVSAPATAKASAGQGLVQIGVYSVEGNAKAAAAALAKAGAKADVRPETSGGKSAWRVVVLPANGAKADAALLAKVKAAGFQDAYLASR